MEEKEEVEIEERNVRIKRVIEKLEGKVKKVEKIKKGSFIEVGDKDLKMIGEDEWVKRNIKEKEMKNIKVGDNEKVVID